MTVSEFLAHVRRMVVDFVVGRVLSETGAGGAEVSGLDNITTYYLLHRHDFGQRKSVVDFPDALQHAPRGRSAHSGAQ